MPHEMSPGKPTTRRYSEAEKERAVRAVRQLRSTAPADAKVRTSYESILGGVPILEWSDAPPATPVGEGHPLDALVAERSETHDIFADIHQLGSPAGGSR